MIDELADRWQLDVGDPFSGGTAAYVAAATDASGRACVLKVAMPLDAAERETFTRSVRAHQLAAARGCVELLAHDEPRAALLLERLGPDLHELGLSVSEILEVIAATLRVFWHPISADSGLRTGDDQARWLSQFIVSTWHDLGRPCDRTVVDRARRLCDRRAAAFDPERSVLVHGDAHGWNTLAAGDGSYRFVDIEGLWSAPEHDLGVAMCEYNEPLVAGDTPALVVARAELLARRCGVDPGVVWEWGFIERVTTGLANLRDFDDGSGWVFLEVAARCLSTPI